jgi:hypothetical protein
MTPDEHATIIKAWEAGATIQYNHPTQGWTDIKAPVAVLLGWGGEHEYRVKPKPLTKYTLIALWENDLMPFASSAEAETPEEAERLIKEEYTGPDSDAPGYTLITAAVVAVVDGEVAVLL